VLARRIINLFSWFTALIAHAARQGKHGLVGADAACGKSKLAGCMQLFLF